MKILNAMIVGILSIVMRPAFAENNISYPDRAWKLNQSGEVIALYDIGDNGKAENVRIENSKPAFLFDESVKSQIYLWRFEKNHPQKDIRIRVIFKKD